MKRYTLEINDEVDSLLSSLTSIVGPNTPKEEIIRRAVATYAYLKKQLSFSENKVSITDRDNRVLMDVDIP